MEKSFEVDQIKDYDWYDSCSENVIYVHYMNQQVFDTVPPSYTLRYAISKNFDASKYCQVIEVE